MPAYRQFTIGNFSGALCIDELHLGHRTLLLAAEPLGDFPVAFALVSANDQEHMSRFLKNLRNHGFLPKVVVTDGSNLYPKVLADVWPDAHHQLCVFHVIKDVNTHVFDALRRLRRRLTRKGGRRTIVRFVVLALDRWRKQRIAEEKIPSDLNRRPKPQVSMKNSE